MELCGVVDVHDGPVVVAGADVVGRSRARRIGEKRRDQSATMAVDRAWYDQDRVPAIGRVIKTFMIFLC